MTNSPTPYDDVFRTLINDCSSLLLPLLNEIFQESYTGTENILFFPNELYLNQQDGASTKRITDTSFIIKSRKGIEKRRYHLECQSSVDNTMSARLFEYDAQIALNSRKINCDNLIVSFPHSAILYLRHHPGTPDHIVIIINTYSGELYHKIPIMKISDYSIENIFEKQLLFLIPFHIFHYEKHFKEISQSIIKLHKLQEKYLFIFQKLELFYEKGIINEYTKHTIIDMSKRVLEQITKKYPKIKEGVWKVFGGQILEYEAKTILNEGIKEGIQKGRSQGEFLGKIKCCAELIQDGILDLETASKRLHMTRQELEKHINELSNNNL